MYYGLRYSAEYLGLEVPDEISNRVARWGPIWPASVVMDAFVPLALYPAHPDHPSRASKFARLLLFVRSHWIRMPPWLLFYHLTYKFFARRFPGTKSVRNQR